MQNFLFTSDIFKGSRYEKGHPLDMDRVWPSVELIQLMGVGLIMNKLLKMTLQK